MAPKIDRNRKVNRSRVGLKKTTLRVLPEIYRTLIPTMLELVDGFEKHTPEELAGKMASLIGDSQVHTRIKKRNLYRLRRYLDAQGIADWTRG